MNASTQNKNYAFIEITFSKEDKNYFYNLVQGIVHNDSLYYSPVIERIKGNMANTLHCTLFYGLRPESIDNLELRHLINEANINIKEIQLGDLFFIEGYQGLYRVLCIEVLDKDKYLETLSNEIGNFSDVEYKFKPHLTLAYVRPGYSLPKTLPDINKIMKVEKVKISLKLDI